MGLGWGTATQRGQHRGLREGPWVGGTECSTRNDGRRPHSVLALWVGCGDRSRKPDPAVPITASGQEPRQGWDDVSSLYPFSLPNAHAK